MKDDNKDGVKKILNEIEESITDFQVETQAEQDLVIKGLLKLVAKMVDEKFD